ncbi:MAG: rubredoxin-like domain-containing protein [Candidatus Goldiibacteriota bacterium]|jgi:hypothetical protein
MAELVKCKSCGFVMEAGKLHDKCPACGVPAKMFEPFIDPVSEKRRMLLGFHIHPILVHFPQAFAFLLFLLACATFFLAGPLKDALITTIRIVSAILPAVVLIALLSGLLDGKIRFRRYNTPFLITKITAGSLFLLTSIIICVLALKCPLETGHCMAIYTALTVISVCCSVPLGIIGTWLIEAKFPG